MSQILRSIPEKLVFSQYSVGSFGQHSGICWNLLDEKIFGSGIFGWITEEASLPDIFSSSKTGKKVWLFDRQNGEEHGPGVRWEGRVIPTVAIGATLTMF